MSLIPQDIKLYRRTQELELKYDDAAFRLPAEFLRVLSPSAEVRGHGPGQGTLPLDKQGVAITGIEPQGNYALRLIFSDGHDSGIYTWEYLRELSENQATLWQQYQARATEAKANAGLSVVKIIPPKQ